MPTSRYITRLVNLEPTDYRIVRRFADEKGLGGKGFSAALRIIIREWRSLHSPSPLQGEGAGGEGQSEIRNPQSEI